MTFAVFILKTKKLCHPDVRAGLLVCGLFSKDFNDEDEMSETVNTRTWSTVHDDGDASTVPGSEPVQGQVNANVPCNGCRQWADIGHLGRQRV